MVSIYDKNGRLVGHVRTPGIAAERTGADAGNVVRCLQGKLNSTGGYVFIEGDPSTITGMAIKEYFLAKELNLAAFINRRKREIISGL